MLGAGIDDCRFNVEHFITPSQTGNVARQNSRRKEQRVEAIHSAREERQSSRYFFVRRLAKRKAARKAARNVRKAAKGQQRSIPRLNLSPEKYPSLGGVFLLSGGSRSRIRWGGGLDVVGDNSLF